MDEFDYLMDWDLEAIVRGSTIEAPATIDDPFLDFSEFCEQDDVLGNFPEFTDTTRIFDDLEELYKPFYPVLHPLSSQNSVLPIAKESEQVKELDIESGKVALLQDLQVPPVVTKCKKSSKKKQNKKSIVMKQVRTEEGLCDAWAWRKYGQKPIKGSPYPRSYYRCSSSKGCLARKQVERSYLDPGVFLVTYTEEHSHPHPTRRNSLAGITRRNNNNTSSSINNGVPSRTPSIEERSKVSLKKEEEDFHERLDGNEYRQLALDGCHL